MPLFGPPNIKKLAARADVRGLIKALGDNDISVRLDAARELARLGDAQAVEPLLALPWAKMQAADLLIKLEDPRAFDVCAELLESDDTMERAHAAGCLTRLNDPRSALVLVAALDDAVAALDDDRVTVWNFDLIENLAVALGTQHISGAVPSLALAKARLQYIPRHTQAGLLRESPLRAVENAIEATFAHLEETRNVEGLLELTQLHLPNTDYWGTRESQVQAENRKRATVSLKRTGTAKP